MSLRIGLVTCALLPEPDPDQELLLAALRARGHGAELVPWDEPGADPAAFDLCVLRSCWNYHQRPEDFRAWIDRAERVTRLANPASILRENLHKSYLAALERDGLPIVPTVWIARGSAPSLARIAAERDWGDVVVKPAISAGSFRTRRFRRDELRSGETFLSELAAERDALVQPYVAAVEAGGERALVWIGGAFTHRVEKRPRFAGQEEQVSEARALSEEERRFGLRALRGLEERILYARVDVFRDADGALRLSELELIEPSLFLLQCPAALARFVGAIESYA